jgi:acetylornithine deacetylase
MSTTTPISTSTSKAAATQAALAALDMPGLIACLQEIIAIPSITGTPAESTAQRRFAQILRENSFDTDEWQIDLPSTTSHQDFPGMEAPRTEAVGVVGRWGNIEGKTLILNGHMDIVPVGDLNQWTQGGPFEGVVRDGNLYGRGACDMKGGLICNLFAVKALQAAGIRLKGNVLLQSVIGEEDGGLGTFATLLRGYRGDAAIITEPTELDIIPACAGALTFRLRMSGRSTHASARLSGVSVIEKFMLVWNALRDLESRRNSAKHRLMQRYELPYALNIGTLQAGNWPSSVPDALQAEGRIGVALEETPALTRQDMEQAVAAVCEADPWLRENPVVIEWFGGQFASGQISIEHPLINMVSDIHQSLNGNVPALYGAPYGSDLRLMVGLGNIPTLHYGPGSVRHAHAPNEFVPVAELETVTRTLIVSILEFCGYE